MKKIRTFVQQKSKKKYPLVSNLERQFESRAFPSPLEATPEQNLKVPGEFEGKKPSGFNFANIAIFPPEGEQTPGVTPMIQPQEMEQDSEAIATPEEELTEPAPWLDTLKRERVADLFQTPCELDGHVQQIQLEINRLISDCNRRKLEGETGEVILQYTTALSALRNALIARAQATEFDFEKFGLTLAPLGSDLYLERTEGLVKVDGKPL